MDYWVKLGKSLIFGQRLFFLLVSYLLGILTAFLFESSLYPFSSTLYFVCLMSVFLLTRITKKYSFLILSISLFLCSLLYYLAVLSHQKSTPILDSHGTVKGVVWDIDKDFLKVKLLRQNNKYLGYFLTLKSSIHVLPIGTLVELSPKQIKERYYRPKRFLNSSQVPLPWMNQVDFFSRVIEGSAKIRFYLKKKMGLTFKNYPNLQSFCMNAVVQIKGEESQAIHSAMKNLGLTHIFAVSGFHVSILSLFVLFSCRLLKFNFVSSFIALSIFLISYAVVTGFSASIFRAFIFSLILFPKQVLHQDTDRIHILSMICFLHLLVNPLEIFSIGFQLSYGITFLLLLYSRKQNSSFKLWLLQAITMQACIYVYFLFYFQEFPLFSFVGIFLTPLFSIILMIGFLLLFIPTVLLDVSLLQWGLGFLEFVLSNTFEIGENLNYILTSNVVWKLYFVLPSFLSLIVVYLVLEKVLSRTKRRFILQGFLTHLVSIGGKDLELYKDLSDIQKWELEYLIYKDLEKMNKTRLKHSYEVCKEWLTIMKFSKIEVFIDILLNSFYKDLYLKLCENTMNRQNYSDLCLELDRFLDQAIGGKLISCDHLHSLFRGFCKRHKVVLTSENIRHHMSVVLSYQRFQTLRNYSTSSLISSFMFLKYLWSTHSIFKPYNK